MSTTVTILEDIKNNPERHMHHDFNGLHRCAFVDGAINLSVIDAHGGLYGHNGGVACDVASGPCSCGAYH